MTGDRNRAVAGFLALIVAAISGSSEQNAERHPDHTGDQTP